MPPLLLSEDNKKGRKRKTFESIRLLMRSSDAFVSLPSREVREMAKYVFPAVIEQASDGFNVSFPDLENCFTCGETFDEAIEMAGDVLPLMLCRMEENEEPIPEASALSHLHLKANETAVNIETDTMEYRKKLSV